MNPFVDLFLFQGNSRPCPLCPPVSLARRVQHTPLQAKGRRPVWGLHRGCFGPGRPGRIPKVLPSSVMLWLLAHIQISLSLLGYPVCPVWWTIKMNILFPIPFFRGILQVKIRGFRSADIDLVEPGIIYQFVQFLQFMFIDAAVQQGRPWFPGSGYWWGWSGSCIYSSVLPVPQRIWWNHGSGYYTGAKRTSPLTF